MRRVPVILLLAAVLQAAPVAMVTDCRGEVRRAGAPVTLTLELEAGAPLTLGAGASVTLLVYGSGEELHLTGPGAFKLDARGAAQGPAAGIRRTREPGLALREPLKPGGLAQASLVMREAADFDLQEPAQAVVREAPVRFRWAPVKGAGPYRFTLRGAGGEVLMNVTTTEVSVPVPPGSAYRWELAADLPGVRTLHAGGEVRVLDSVRGRDLDRLKAAAGSFSLRVVYAAALQVSGLEDEARAEWRVLAELRPEDPVLKGLAR